MRAIFSDPLVAPGSLPNPGASGGVARARSQLPSACLICCQTSFAVLASADRRSATAAACFLQAHPRCQPAHHALDHDGPHLDAVIRSTDRGGLPRSAQHARTHRHRLPGPNEGQRRGSFFARYLTEGLRGGRGAYGEQAGAAGATQPLHRNITRRARRNGARTGLVASRQHKRDLRAGAVVDGLPPVRFPRGFR